MVIEFSNHTWLMEGHIEDLLHLRVVRSHVEDDLLLLLVAAAAIAAVVVDSCRGHGAGDVDWDEVLGDLGPLYRARARRGHVEHLGPQSANGNRTERKRPRIDL